MSKHTFLRNGKSVPEVGDLVRNSTDTPNYINIVLEVTGPLDGADSLKRRVAYCLVRSVRYGHTNDGDFKLLNGRRSRLFKWYMHDRFKWDVVDEYVKMNNKVERMAIVESLVGVDTAYNSPEVEE